MKITSDESGDKVEVEGAVVEELNEDEEVDTDKEIMKSQGIRNRKTGAVEANATGRSGIAFGRSADQIVPTLNQRESHRMLVELLRQLLARQIQQSEQIEELRTTVKGIQAQLAPKKKLPPPKQQFVGTKSILGVVVVFALQLLVMVFWFGDGKLFPDIKIKKN